MAIPGGWRADAEKDPNKPAPIPGTVPVNGSGTRTKEIIPGTNSIPVIGGFLGPTQADTSGAQAAQNASYTKAAALGAERAGFVPNAAPQQEAQTIATGPQGEIRTGQTQALAALADAAAGKTPSPAEIQARMGADRAAAQQFGMAAAAGGNPAAALRMASLGAARVQGENTAQGALLRAQEIEAARKAHVAALQGVRQQDIGLATDQAQLNRAAAGNNLTANLTNNAQSIDWRKALLGGELGQMNQGADTAVGALTAATKNAEGENKFKSGVLNLVGGLI